MLAFLERVPTGVYLGFPIVTYLVAFALLRRRDGPWWLLSSLSFFFAAVMISYGISLGLAFRESGLLGDHSYGEVALASFWLGSRWPLLIAILLCAVGSFFAVYPPNGKASHRGTAPSRTIPYEDIDNHG